MTQVRDTRIDEDYVNAIGEAGGGGVRGHLYVDNRSIGARRLVNERHYSGETYRIRSGYDVTGDKSVFADGKSTLRIND